MSEFARVAVASRAFSLAAILGLASAYGNSAALAATALVIGIAAVASYVATISPAPTHWVIVGEAALVSLVVATALPDSVVLLPYLVVLSLLTGLVRGVRGATLAAVPQFAAILVVLALSGSLEALGASGEVLAPWALTIVGAGLIGASTKKIGKSPAGTTVAEKYDSARRLLGQLRNLARRLPSGLDPVTIASEMLEMTEQLTGAEQSAVLTRTKGGLFVPLAYRGLGARELISHEDPAISATWRTATPTIVPCASADQGAPHGRATVLPLRLATEMVGVLVIRSSNEVLADAVDTLQGTLDDVSVRLATALAFDEVRNLVTADERQRLAREIHDGVAQEIASLGYALDELAARAGDPEASAGLRELRGDISRIVTELRLSIFDLRTEVAEASGLGAALSEYLRKVGAQSGLRVHLTLDEAPVRLSPGVETELFRIAQEAITNARKHAGARNLWVECKVKPPSAHLCVRDDGHGLTRGRDNSYGLRIMHERAEQIGARLSIEGSGHGGRSGTTVTVSLRKEASTLAEGIEAAS